MVIQKKYLETKIVHNIVKWEKQMTEFFVWYNSGKIYIKKKLEENT